MLGGWETPSDSNSLDSMGIVVGGLKLLLGADATKEQDPVSHLEPATGRTGV